MTFARKWAAKLTGMSQAVIAVDPIHLGSGDFPDLEEVLAYWQARRNRRLAPRRADLDPPFELRAMLPRIMLVNVLRDPMDFRYRLSGTGICNVDGRDLTGLSPNDMQPPEYGRLIWQHYADCVRHPRPVAHRFHVEFANKVRRYVRLLLPLSEDGSAVTMLLAVDSERQNYSLPLDMFQCIGGLDRGP